MSRHETNMQKRRAGQPHKGWKSAVRGRLGPSAAKKRLAELKAEVRGMDYEGWCKRMGYDYAATGWGIQIANLERIVANEEREALAKLRLLAPAREL